jgi:hypothetical protein
MKIIDSSFLFFVQIYAYTKQIVNTSLYRYGQGKQNEPKKKERGTCHKDDAYDPR